MNDTFKDNFNLKNCLLILVVLFSLFLFLFVPKVSLNGKNVIYHNINTPYIDQGVSSFSFNPNYKIKTVNNVDWKRAGTYYVSYTFKSFLIEFKIKRKVIVKDMKKPVIVLKGKKHEYYCSNSKYKESGYKAIDNLDGDITSKVKVKRKKNHIIYSVTDKALNKTTVVRKISVGDYVKPVITLNGDSNIYLGLNDSYQELGAEAVDNCDGKIEIKVKNKVDSTVLGKQEIIYETIDKSGNKSTLKRVVNVLKPLEVNTIYLTFDDGPKEGTTNVILDILREKNIKATFFVTNNGPDYLIKRIVDEGHTIGIHSATHDYGYIYSSVDNYMSDLKVVLDRIYNLTGVRTNLIRFPGGSSNTVSKKYCDKIMSTLTELVQKNGYLYYDWNLESGDSSFAREKQKLYDSVVSKLSHDRYNVVLMHDIKPYTRDALADIIDYAISNNYNFKSISYDTMPLHQKVNN